MLADATGIEVAVPATDEPVLLGAAILGSVAGGFYPDIPTAMQEMSDFAVRFSPGSEAVRAWHDARFRLFEQLQSVARNMAKPLPALDVPFIA